VFRRSNIREVLDARRPGDGERHVDRRFPRKSCLKRDRSVDVQSEIRPGPSGH